LYPIRAIRRKNIGEAILLSLYFKDGESLAITLPPSSPADMASYGGWKTFAAEGGLNVTFDVGLRRDFASLVHSSKYLITTSISEGFGFSFLEPWTAEKVLFGRRLPGICDDFEADGIGLDHLYSRLWVPIDWVDEIAYHRKWESALLQACSHFGFEIKKEQIDRAFGAMTREGNIDFGLLDEGFQKQVISRVLARGEDYQRVVDLNPVLLRLGDLSDKAELVQRNRRAIDRHYNETLYRGAILSAYGEVIRDRVRHRIDKKALFPRLLDLESFSLLKWGKYAG